ncbi:hypothetical protein OE747_23620 [Ruegeria sp. XHP0148]|uniref:Uncharacterized protein n=1 Tax=Ruegeria aquimaris TaxID=2984333 RepID=A0ABT3ARN1_9RHOB|nr:hypothetical protein [Ruegeria sp. XHP0148]
MAHINAALVQKVFHVPQRQREPDVQHDRQADDLWAGLEIAKRGSFCHGWTLQNRPARLKPVCFDSTIGNNVLQVDFRPVRDGPIRCNRKLGGIVTSYTREVA